MRLALANTSKAPVAAPRPSRRRLTVQSNTLWSLQPDAKWCSKAENAAHCKALAQVDLTGNIGQKRVCSIASHDFKGEETVDYCIVEHGGIHLLFEAEGAACPLDSPSSLFVTDVDSTCSILVDGQELVKGRRAEVKAGQRIAMGSEAVYQVQRNVFAHA